MANTTQSLRFGAQIDPGSLRDTFKKFMHEFNSALKGADTSGMRVSIKHELDLARKDLEKFQRQYEELLSGKVTPKSILALEKELDKASNEADRLSRKLSDSLYNKRDTLMATGQSFSTGVVGEAKIGGRYFTDPKTIAQLRDVNGQIATLERDLDVASTRAEELYSRLQAIKGNPAATEEATLLREQITATTTEIAGMEAQLASLDSVGTETGESLRQQFEGITKSAQKIGHRITGLIKRVFIFSVITKLLRGIRSYLSSVVKQNDALSQSIAQLKGNLSVIFQVIWQAILPAVQWLIKALVTLTTYLAKFLSMLTGKAISGAKKAAQEMNKLGGAAGKAAEKSMAAFDTVQTLDTGSGGGGGGGAIQADYGALETGIDAFIQKLMGYLSIAAFAVGVILAFSGINIPLGITLMAIGAATFVSGVAANWNSLDGPVKQAINSLLAIIAAASLVVGTLLLFLGATPKVKALGLGLLFLGAVSLGAAIALNKNSIPEMLEGIIKDAGIIVGAALLVIGAVLTFSGAAPVMPIGIALLAAGAISLASAAALNSDRVPNEIKKVIAIIFAIVSRAFLVVGAILMFTGVAFLLGLALFVAGVAMIAQEAKADEDYVPSHIRTAINKLFLIVSVALLVLGCVLAFSGVGIALGLALIAAGAVTLVATQGPDWGATLIDKVKSVISTILAVAGLGLIAVGLILCLTGAGIPVGLAMILAGAASIYGSMSLSDNPITNAIKSIINGIIKGINAVIRAMNKLSFTVPDWVPLVGGKHFGFNIREVAYLAKGAVIPPNNEFLAVLGDQKRGTNIEAPLDTIVEAFKQVQGTQGGGAVDIDITFSGNLAKLAELLDIQIQQNRRLKNV